MAALAEFLAVITALVAFCLLLWAGVSLFQRIQRFVTGTAAAWAALVRRTAALDAALVSMARQHRQLAGKVDAMTAAVVLGTWTRHGIAVALGEHAAVLASQQGALHRHTGALDDHKGRINATINEQSKTKDVVAGVEATVEDQQLRICDLESRADDRDTTQAQILSSVASMAAQVADLEDTTDVMRVDLDALMMRERTAWAGTDADVRWSLALGPGSGADLRRDLVPILAPVTPPGKVWSLLYRGSRDQFDADRFHVRCDGKGPTLVLVRTAKGSIFGGYASASWSSPTHTVVCNGPRYARSFLFGLRGMEGGLLGDRPVVLGPKAGDRQFVVCGHDRGPIFGGGADLCLLVRGDERRGTVKAQTYVVDQPTGTTPAFLNGGVSQFTVAELEVYALERRVS